jgi:transcription elongation factor Elf1
MVDYVDLQYTMLLSSRLEKFKVKSTNPYKINFRCPVCGDSQKSRVKARGWLLEKNNSFHFYCHNCYASKTFKTFLKDVDNLVYNDYVTEKYMKNAKDEKLQPLDQMKSSKPEFSKYVNPLKSIKKISQLAFDHPVKQYIEKRQIPTAQHYRLYYAPKFMTWINSLIPNKFPNVEKDEPRLIIPFIDGEGKVFGLSARGFKPNGLRYITIMFEERPKVFGLDKVDFNKRYFVVEGAIDSMFLSNAVAMAGADGNVSGLKNVENATFVFDSEPRNKEIHKRMEKIIRDGHSICIWPSNLPGKDINEMVLSGITDVEKILINNTYKGLEANLKLMAWKKVGA